MHITNRSILKLAALAAAAALSFPALADRGLTDWAGATLEAPKNDELWGWSFEAISAIDVTSLGVYDLDANGLSNAHKVGLFRASDSSLIASVMLASGKPGTLDGGNFRYAALDESVALVAGETYFITMTMPGTMYPSTADRQYVGATQVFTSSAIHYLGSEMGMGGGMEIPDGGFTHSAAGSYAGPNFEYTAAAVPEPETYALMLAGLGVIGFVARRRRAA